jgi:hypothetical protein
LALAVLETEKHSSVYSTFVVAGLFQSYVVLLLILGAIAVTTGVMILILCRSERHELCHFVGVSVTHIKSEAAVVAETYRTLCYGRTRPLSDGELGALRELL